MSRAAADAERFRFRPKVSVLLVVSDPEPAYLDATVESVLGQAYADLELVAFVQNGDGEGARRLAAAAGRDPRLRILGAPTPPGFSAALAAAFRASQGELVATLGDEDVLAPLAIHAAIQRFNDEPETDVVYVDEDRIGPDDQRRDPFFKPDWSPHLLLGTAYLGSFVVYRRALWLAAGGPDPALPGAHFHDLALRATEAARRVEHLPRVLNSVRSRQPGGLPDEQAPFARAGSRRAVTAALRRRGVAAGVEATRYPDVWRVRPAIDPEPLVSILIPTRDAVQLRRSLGSLLERTRYRRFEVVVIDTSDESEGEVAAVIRDLGGEERGIHRLADPSRPFSFARVNNLAAARARGDHLLLLNDDTEVLEPDWLDAMLGLATLPGVGVVGAKLLYPSGLIQHAGVVLGVCGIAGHAFRFYPAASDGYHRMGAVAREVAAVTFACALVTRAAWDRLCGIDEANFPLSYNDVDFCLRARGAGFRILFCPDAVLLHYESATRKTHEAWKGYSYLRQRWRHALAADPYYNPNLTLRHEDWGINLDSEGD